MSDTGYFSVADRGEFGHWDFGNGRMRVFKLRGDTETGFTLFDERAQRQPPVSFHTPFAALEYVARQMMEPTP